MDATRRELLERLYPDSREHAPPPEDRSPPRASGAALPWPPRARRRPGGPAGALPQRRVRDGRAAGRPDPGDASAPAARDRNVQRLLDDLARPPRRGPPRG